MPSAHGAFVVFGSGPGVGRAVACCFAEHGFQKVFLVSRDAGRLSKDADAVKSAHADVDVYEIPADMGCQESVRDCLREIETRLDGMSLECMVFNAGRAGSSEILTFPADQLKNDLEIAIVGLYMIAQWALPKLLNAQPPCGVPSLLVTSGMLAKDPFPAMFSLAACKAGQYSLVHSLHKEFEAQGVHCGVVVIGGAVSDESKVTNPRNIANEVWNMFLRPKGDGALEIVLKDPAYSEHVLDRERK